MLRVTFKDDRVELGITIGDDETSGWFVAGEDGSRMGSGLGLVVTMKMIHWKQRNYSRNIRMRANHTYN